MDPITTLLQGYMPSGNPSQSNQGKSFADLLKERRNFVQSTEDSAKGQADNAVNNGSNGVAISPAATYTPLENAYTTNENGTTALLNLLVGAATQQADRGLRAKEIENTNKFNMGNLGLQAEQQGREDYLAGYGGNSGSGAGTGTSTGGTPGTGSSYSPLVESTAQNVMKGTQDLDSLNMPQTLKNQVQQRLGELGYDPAKDVNTYMSQLKNAYFNNDSSGSKGAISSGNDLGNGIQNGFGGLLDFLTKGILQTPREQQIKNYGNLKNSLASNLQSLLGRDRKLSPKLISQLSSSLPEVGDTKEQATKKFSQIQDLINATYYQGGQPPTAGNNDPLGILGK